MAGFRYFIKSIIGLIGGQPDFSAIKAGLPPPAPEFKLLTEIRDLLQRTGGRR
ncbi:MAG: hypothetical protein ABSC04_06090 [Syntrophobacteraceae bacterium]|jgi:hypothetical protein